MSSVSIAGENFVKDMASLEKSKAMISNLTMVPFVLLISLGETFVVEAKVWIDNGQIASLIYVKDCNTGTSIEDYQKINRLEGRLRSVLQGDSDVRSATTSLSDVVIHPERRLHQMMYADRDYQKNQMFEFTSETPLVTLQNWAERGYSIVNVQCKDRSKLLFDVVFNLTDMEYVVFHATIHTRIDQAYLEFYKRHKDGTPISSEPERQRLIQCLQAAVERRSCKDRSKLLFDVVFNLTDMEYVVFHATIHTRIDQAYLEFYKRHKDGTPISSEPERQRLIQCLQAAVERRSCKDRSKLLFDVVFNLTDMEYVVFHATIHTRIDQAYLEFYKRHKDGTPISSEPERQRLIQCLQAAVERRSCKGVRLELSTEDRQGLLAEVMRTFRENGLNVTRADIATIGYLAANTFYVTDAIGYLLGFYKP
ncbi:ACT domain-containing protein ACR8 [Trifolium repens]|nr:ACT domain-containing protein ACR8 [Trifolium repens]